MPVPPVPPVPPAPPYTQRNGGERAAWPPKSAHKNQLSE